VAKKRQLERKKKARESKAKARVEASRHKAMLLKKDERRQAKLNNKFRDKLVPFIKDPERKKALEEAEAQKSRDKLERNMQILKALEEEYEKDKDAKKAINDQLEAEGHITLQDKLNALEKKARDSMTGEEAETGQIDLSKDA
jgi:hypothetical protein